MDVPQICTQMPLPEELRVEADVRAVQENPLNAHQITAGEPIQVTNGGSPVALALPVGSMWKNGRTLRVKILNGSSKIQNRVRHYASLWSQYANIKFNFVDTGDAEIRVNIDASGSSWSYVGTDNLTVASNKPTMTFGWLTDSTTETEFSRVIIHEFGHALGCIHEHQSPGAKIPWNVEKVYAYYKKAQNWDKAAVDTNIFTLYSSTTTQYSLFDPSSIMLYAIPSSLTTNGFSTDWNTEMSQTDKNFIGGAYPAEAIGHDSFNTLEVRPWNQPRADTIKRVFFTEPSPTAPLLAVGLTWLDIDQSSNIRINAYADQVNGSSADFHLMTWADTTLYDAACTWFHRHADDSDFQIGQFSTIEDHPWDKPQTTTSRQITFARPYTSIPRVVVWLNSIDMDKDKNWRVYANATNISTTGFTLNLGTWADSLLYSAGASWIAYPGGRTDVASGTFDTAEVRPWDPPQLDTSGKAIFPGMFAMNPTILMAFNRLDIGKGHNLRLRLSANSISPQGMCNVRSTWW